MCFWRTLNRYDEWEKYTQELEAMDLHVTNFTTIISSKIYSFLSYYTTKLKSIVIAARNYHYVCIIFVPCKDVDQRVGSVLQMLHNTRAREARDFALLEDNSSYVTFWSVLQCLIIFATTAVQVFFVRKLFDGPTSSVKGGKVRA